MAFTFGNSNAPAPAGGGFTFASSSSTPAAPAFGSNPAPASFGTPAPSGFSFGGGSSTTPAPASFGSTASPAPAFGFGGSSTAQAPSTGFSFASTPAPSTGFSFGSTTPASAPSTGLFGTTPAPSPFGAPLFGAASPSPFGVQQQQQQQPQQQLSQPTIAGNMHYSSLPEHYRRAIDSIHDAMMKHKRTMSQIKTMRPSGLVTEDSSLPAQVQKLQRETLGLENDLRKTREVVDAQGVHSETLLTQIFHFGIWPTEAVAVRRGVRLSEMVEEKKDDELQTRIRALLDGQMVHVERLERMPSPFLLQLMDTMQERADKLKTMLRKLEYEMNQSRDVNVHSILGLQHQQLHQVASKIVAIQQEMQKLRATYQVYERGENVIEKADREEFERKQREEDAILMHYLKAGQSNASQQQQTPGAPAPAFGASPAPATSFSFGSTTTAPAPVFGSTTTPTAPAPLGGGFSVSTPRTSSKKKGGSKSSDRLKR